MSKPNKPLFSIIVPVYNVRDYLVQCIESVLAQTVSDYEIILVDDGSTDGSGEICDKYARKGLQISIISQNSKKINRKATHQPYIQVIHQKNQGLSAARNTGVDEACGEYLIFLDGDDYLEINALESIKNGLEPDLDLLRYQAQEVFDDGRTVEHREEGFSIMTGVKAFPLLARYHYTENAWLYAYRTEFFKKNHFRYAEGCIAEDMGLTPLVVAQAQTVKSIPDICYNYRQRAGSIMHTEGKDRRRVNDIYKQLYQILPEIAKLNGSVAILHYLVVSYLTTATLLGKQEFLENYQKAKSSGFLSYIHPGSIKAVPRAVLLKHFPKLFYQIYKGML